MNSSDNSTACDVCKGDHSKHVCHMANEMNRDLDKITGIVKDPKFICFNCARVANKEECLCNPMPL